MDENISQHIGNVFPTFDLYVTQNMLENISPSLLKAHRKELGFADR